jgi:hypothetical protein
VRCLFFGMKRKVKATVSNVSQSNIWFVFHSCRTFPRLQNKEDSPMLFIKIYIEITRRLPNMATSHALSVW